MFVEVAVECGQLHARHEWCSEHKGQIIPMDAATSRWMVTAFCPVSQLVQKGLSVEARVSQCSPDERSGDSRVSQNFNHGLQNITRLVGGWSATPVRVLVRDRQMDFLTL